MVEMLESLLTSLAGTGENIESASSKNPQEGVVVVQETQPDNTRSRIKVHREDINRDIIFSGIGTFILTELARQPQGPLYDFYQNLPVLDEYLIPAAIFVAGGLLIQAASSGYQALENLIYKSSQE